MDVRFLRVAALDDLADDPVGTTPLRQASQISTSQCPGNQCACKSNQTYVKLTDYWFASCSTSLFLPLCRAEDYAESSKEHAKLATKDAATSAKYATKGAKNGPSLL